MDLKETLIGKVVALDPKHLSQDNILLSKQTAIILCVEIKLGKAVVAFEDGKSEAIEFSKLIVLKPYEDIVRKLNRSWKISPADFQMILEISQLYRKKLFREAMEQALSNETVRKICIVNCQNWIMKELKKRRIPKW